MGFLDAALYPLRGLAYLARRPALWPWAGAAFAVNVVLFTAGIVAFIVWLPDLSRALTPESWPSWTVWISGLLVAAAGLLAVVFLFTVVGNLVAAPFLDALAERALRDLGEALPPGPPLGRMLLKGVAGQVLKLAILAAVHVPLIALLVTPAAPIVPLLSGAAAAFFLAVEYLDYPLGARGLGTRARLRYVAGRAGPSMGFGTACLLLHLVPLLGYAALPACVCGAVLLARRLDGVQKSGYPSN